MISQELREAFVDAIKAKHEHETRRKEMWDAKTHQTDCFDAVGVLLHAEFPESALETVSSVVVRVDGRVYHPSLDEEDGSLIIEEVTERTEVIEE